MPPKLKIKRLSEAAVIPRYMTSESAGMDLSAAVGDPLEIPPGHRAVVPTGLAIELPSGYEGQIRPRSGLAVRQGLTVLNAPGTIDADYRGEVKVALVNLGDQPVVVQGGMRVAQLVVAAVVQPEVSEVAELTTTDRGSGGFGHTGG